MREPLDLYALLAIYAAVGTILVEATYELPLALIAEWGRLARS